MTGWAPLIITVIQLAREHGTRIHRRTDVNGRPLFEVLPTASAASADERVRGIRAVRPRRTPRRTTASCRSRRAESSSSAATGTRPVNSSSASQLPPFGGGVFGDNWGACWDTHAVARALTDAEFTPAQADAITDAVRQAAKHGDQVMSDQFTAGLAEVRTEITALDTRISIPIAGVRTEIASLENPAHPLDGRHRARDWRADLWDLAFPRLGGRPTPTAQMREGGCDKRYVSSHCPCGVARLSLGRQRVPSSFP